MTKQTKRPHRPATSSPWYATGLAIGYATAGRKKHAELIARGVAPEDAAREVQKYLAELHKQHG